MTVGNFLRMCPGWHETCSISVNPLESILNIWIEIRSGEADSRDLRVERCGEETRLCASCTALVQAPLSMLSATGDLLVALQVIFSRYDAEPNLLCKALQKFENFLNSKGEDEEYEQETIAVLKQIKRARNSSQWIGKEARLFHRNVLRFLDFVQIGIVISSSMGIESGTGNRIESRALARNARERFWIATRRFWAVFTDMTHHTGLRALVNPVLSATEKRARNELTPLPAPAASTAKRTPEAHLTNAQQCASFPALSGSMESLNAVEWENDGHTLHPTVNLYASIEAPPPWLQP
ncbi:hypothetical protein EVAR_86545_1 [Eumeta japonica]|uniref:Uncharacterized protein n=1 Tax=Eumeta variegata TaxID=151549 RepID=A0A4C1ZIB3_EUMVA|nr:hypothetical protein EVAR_86545_1 [Eumeta japonica]